MAVSLVLSVFMLLKARRTMQIRWVNFLTVPPATAALLPLFLGTEPIASRAVLITLRHGGSEENGRSQSTANHTEPKWLQQEYCMYHQVCAEWRQAQPQPANKLLARYADTQHWRHDDKFNPRLPVQKYIPKLEILMPNASALTFRTWRLLQQHTMLFVITDSHVECIGPLAVFERRRHSGYPRKSSTSPF